MGRPHQDRTAGDVQRPERRLCNHGKDSILGYSLHAVIGRAPDNSPRILGFEVRPGNEPEADAGATLIERLADRRTIPDLAADRGYTAGTPFHERMLAKGINVYFDLTEAQTKMSSTIPDAGGIASNGSPMCPGTPQGLLQIGRAPSAVNKIDPEAHAERYQRWEPFVAPRHGKKRLEDKSMRHSCPARRGKVRCPLFPESMALDADKAPLVMEPPAGPHLPKTCTQETVKIPPFVGNQPMTADPYGGETWKSTYRPYRSGVEGVFGNLKGPGYEVLIKGRFLLRGSTRVTLLLACALAAYNVRMALKLAAGYRDRAKQFEECNSPEDHDDYQPPGDTEGHTDPDP